MVSPTNEASCSSEKEGDSPKLPPPLKEPIMFDYCAFGQQQMIDLANGSYEDRLKASIPVTKVSSEHVLQKAPMTLVEHVISTLTLACGVPVGVFNIPIFLFLIGKLIVGNVLLVFQLFGLLVLLPLAILPQTFQPWVLQSQVCILMIKYFSWRFVVEEFPDPTKPRIMVGPPHGVFPYGCLLTMICHPSCTGIHCRGLAARAAVATPIFKQIMRSLGIVDANRVTAQRVLEKPSCLGISTGGVAEIFETNHDDEVILLRERIGLIKLAIRTGADLQPCYIFGNTDILACWMGEGIPGGRSFLSSLSRKLGFGILMVFGRFGLPIPYRIPCLGVTGKAIRTDHMKCDNPSDEQVVEIQGKLIVQMQDVFERYKGLYGWENKHLIIK